MGFFSNPWLTKEEHERSVHLNLISRINSLELIAHELGAKLQVAQGRVDELHNQAPMNGRLLGENAELRERIAELEHDCEMRRATNIGQAQTLDGYASRIAELEAALKPLMAINTLYVSPQIASVINAVRKALEGKQCLD